MSLSLANLHSLSILVNETQKISTSWFKSLFYPQALIDAVSVYQKNPNEANILSIYISYIQSVNPFQRFLFRCLFNFSNTPLLKAFILLEPFKLDLQSILFKELASHETPKDLMTGLDKLKTEHLINKKNVQILIQSQNPSAMSDTLVMLHSTHLLTWNAYELLKMDSSPRDIAEILIKLNELNLLSPEIYPQLTARANKIKSINDGLALMQKNAPKERNIIILDSILNHSNPHSIGKLLTLLDNDFPLTEEMLHLLNQCDDPKRWALLLATLHSNDFLNKINLKEVFSTLHPLSLALMIETILNESSLLKGDCAPINLQHLVTTSLNELDPLIPFNQNFKYFQRIGVFHNLENFALFLATPLSESEHKTLKELIEVFRDEKDSEYCSPAALFTQFMHHPHREDFPELIKKLKKEKLVTPHNCRLLLNYNSTPAVQDLLLISKLPDFPFLEEPLMLHFHKFAQELFQNPPQLVVTRWARTRIFTFKGEVSLAGRVKAESETVIQNIAQALNLLFKAGLLHGKDSIIYFSMLRSISGDDYIYPIPIAAALVFFAQENLLTPEIRKKIIPLQHQLKIIFNLITTLKAAHIFEGTEGTNRFSVLLDNPDLYLVTDLVTIIEGTPILNNSQASENFIALLELTARKNALNSDERFNFCCRVKKEFKFLKQSGLLTSAEAQENFTAFMKDCTQRKNVNLYPEVLALLHTLKILTNELRDILCGETHNKLFVLIGTLKELSTTTILKEKDVAQNNVKKILDYFSSYDDYDWNRVWLFNLIHSLAKTSLLSNEQAQINFQHLLDYSTGYKNQLHTAVELLVHRGVFSDNNAQVNFEKVLGALKPLLCEINALKLTDKTPVQYANLFRRLGFHIEVPSLSTQGIFFIYKNKGLFNERLAKLPSDLLDKVIKGTTP